MATDLQQAAQNTVDSLRAASQPLRPTSRASGQQGTPRATRAAAADLLALSLEPSTAAQAGQVAGGQTNKRSTPAVADTRAVLGPVAEGGSCMICKGRPFAPERRIFDILLLAAEGAKLEVSKIGLMWSDTGAGPSSEAAAAMFDALLQRVAQCCAALVAAQQGAGPTLRQALFAGAKAVTEGCVELVQGLALEGSRGEAALHLVGVASSRCEALPTLPVSDQAAIGRALSRVARAIKDVLRELKENTATAAPQAGTLGSSRTLQQVAPGAPQTSDGVRISGAQQAAQSAAPSAAKGTATAPSSSESECDDLDFEADPLSPAEQRVCRVAARAVQSSLDIMKWCIAALLQQPSSGVLPEIVGAWENVLFHARNIEVNCSMLGAATYAPQDKQEVSGAAGAVLLSCELLLQELEPAFADSAKSVGLFEDIEAISTAMHEAISAL